MASLISIITPIYDPHPAYLTAAHASLAAQTLPPGWSWEWIVQEDGGTGAAEALLPRDPRIRPARGRHGGVAITRNLGLARAGGSLVKNLDQDDVLTPGALARDIEAMSDPATGWATSRALDLLPDGTTAANDNDPDPGPIPRGAVAAYWRTHGHRLPVHPTTLCIRRTLAVALGGWMAVPGSDDTGLLIAAGEIAPGHFTGEPGLLYRKWPGQVSAGDSHTEPVERALRMRLIDERAQQLAAMFDRREDQRQGQRQD
ncbi:MULTISPECIES: glycosyltransferase [unclassified Streptomyces]|uniref:glycosyltransferase family 2 protein n=1 Tax=unclassified Streptomyces TaxID=2593676 RepID=UPI0013A70969|nr:MULTISPECIES: glycosyltransferase [unclassified Streptomyces]QZZ26763.1 glycosyltransferase [Streptomyces sp. ST1015]